MTTTISTWDIERMARNIATQLPDRVALVGIPRGGLSAAYAIAAQRKPNQTIEVRSADDWNAQQAEVDQGQFAVYLVDDVLATGKTIKEVSDKFPDGTFSGYICLGYKEGAERNLPVGLISQGVWRPDSWISFPWESREQGGAPLDAVTRLIEYLGEDPNRDGLLETPRRVLGFLDEMKARRTAEFSITTFDAGEFNDLTIVRNISFASLCEHHMLPYHGSISVGYLPDKTVLGLSKIPRIIDLHSAGLTMQEHLTDTIAREVGRMARTESVGVVASATHTCVTMRGPKALNTEMVSSAMLGKFREDPELRAEFLSLIGG